MRDFWEILENLKGCLPIATGMLFGIVFCLLITMCGCKGVKEVQTETQIERVEVPVPVIQEHHTENVRVDLVRDTLIRHDSVSYYIKGDTVRIEKWHYLTHNNVQYKVDTLVKVEYVEKPVTVTNTVEKVKTVTQEVEVEKKLNKWQQFKMDTGGLMLALLGIAIIAFGVWGVLKLRKKMKI